jgi:hypothetical protein
VLSHWQDSAGLDKQLCCKQASSTLSGEEVEGENEASASRQEEALLLVFDILVAAGQQLNGSARCSPGALL